MIQQTLDKMKFESEKRDRMLDISKVLIEAWVHHISVGEYKIGDQMDAEMRAVIQNQVELEWGKKTIANFDESSLSVLVINPDGREYTYNKSQSLNQEGA